MRRPQISKVVVHTSVGKSGEQLQKAMTILEQITGQQPCQRIAKKTIREWGIRRREPIACMVTLRGGKAEEFLTQAFEAVGNRILKSRFDANGNFAFGIREHIEIRGMRYDPSLGIIGMDVCVTLEKPGYHVKRRRIRKSQIGKEQKLTRDEAINYLKETYGITIDET
ncbi:MAG: 50S ribosomal protein L5 [Candidatus Bathyarchaeota archaeon]|nr:MAG: 50S ribosomal protein L5 [Candidatus Bathyarchaeota archaeon]